MKREHGRIQGLPIFWVPPIISFKFGWNINRVHQNKSPLKISGKVAVDVLWDSKFFRALIYRAHRTVIFAIAQFLQRVSIALAMQSAVLAMIDSVCLTV